MAYLDNTEMPLATKDQQADYKPAPKAKKPVLYLDCGHAGRNTQIKSENPFDQYATQGKSVDWGRGQGGRRNLPIYRGKTVNLHGQGRFCEGIENRTDGEALIKLLEPYVKSGKLEIVKLYHEWEDTPLRERTNKANADWAKKGNPPALGISLHYNAASGQAKGIIAFTSPGHTKSDNAAELILDKLESKGIPRWKKDIDNPSPCIRRKGDDIGGGHEERFAMLVNTNMPFVLMESGFMTTLTELLEIMYNPQSYKAPMLEAYAAAIADFLELNNTTKDTK